MSFFINLLKQLSYAVKRSNPLKTRFVILVHRARGDTSFVTFFFNTVVKGRKTVKSTKNTICDTCTQNSQRYQFCYNFAHIVEVRRKTVKSAKNTICDTCSQNSLRYEFCDIFLYIVVKILRTVK